MARWIQRLLFAAGLVILGYCGAYYVNSRLEQIRGNRELDRILTSRPPSSPKQGAKPAIPEGGLVGRVEIPKLRLSAVVFQGTTDKVLDEGVGHLDSSALPGQPGNVVLAAHRDTFFRSLRNIQKGDTVRVTTPYGVRTYTVDSTTIVDPTQTSVMAPTPSPTLTLITCYPFYFVGHAPKRFIVRARDTETRTEPVLAENRSPRQVRQQRGQSDQAPVVVAPLSDQDSENLTYIFHASDDVSPDSPSGDGNDAPDGPAASE